MDALLLNQDCRLTEACEVLSEEMKDLYFCQKCSELSKPPSPLQFYREFVSQNRPVIIKNAINHWPALKKWTPDYLRKKIGNQVVTVAVTPNGYADAICDGYFVTPEERKMRMSEFLDIMTTPRKDRTDKGVFYIQKQNSNLTEEFLDLMTEVDADIGWGTTAFGRQPDAVNFWMGDEKAVTSMHRDHYENLYCVVSGRKTFILHPPTDLPYIPYESYSSGTFKETNGKFAIIPEENGGKVSWIAIDPLCPDLQLYPSYSKAHRLTVTVEAGDMLYLPSLWFHHVRQSQGCIAVNYWYDMDFDIKWAYYKFLEKMFSSSPIDPNGD